MSWHTEPLIGFDLETTGVDVETARIVTAAVVGAECGARLWLADPGIDIPAGASAVHGVTTAHAREYGQPALEVAGEIAQALAHFMRDGHPVVVMNARFDFSILDRELRRHGLATLDELLGRPIAPVIDPLVMDKQADKYRKGSRQLTALAAHYAVPLAAAHTADADAQAAADVAVAIAVKYPPLQVDAARVHRWQIQWAAEQAAGLEAFKRRTVPGFVAERAWPLVPFRGEQDDVAQSPNTK